MTGRIVTYNAVSGPGLLLRLMYSPTSPRTLDIVKESDVRPVVVGRIEGGGCEATGIVLREGGTRG